MLLWNVGNFNAIVSSRSCRRNFGVSIGAGIGVHGKKQCYCHVSQSTGLHKPSVMTQAHQRTESGTPELGAQGGGVAPLTYFQRGSSPPCFLLSEHLRWNQISDKNFQAFGYVVWHLPKHWTALPRGLCGLSRFLVLPKFPAIFKVFTKAE